MKNFEKLEKHIVDAIKEQHLKLGYLRESVQLFYPLASLQGILGKECDVAEAEALLAAFAVEVAPRLGKVQILRKKERFTIVIPEEGNAYIHEHEGKDEFLADLIECVRNHGCQMEQVFAVFRKYSEKVHVEAMPQTEFDYLVYFENGEPDAYWYCLTDEGHHVTYHRFTKEDYEAFEW